MKKIVRWGACGWIFVICSFSSDVARFDQLRVVLTFDDAFEGRRLIATQELEGWLEKDGKVLAVDDGWQTDDTGRGYAFVRRRLSDS